MLCFPLLRSMHVLELQRSCSNMALSLVVAKMAYTGSTVAGFSKFKSAGAASPVEPKSYFLA